MASAFLGKYASIAAVDLIQPKKLDSRNFYESNLTEARFNSLPFYSNNYGKFNLVAMAHFAALNDRLQLTPFYTPLIQTSHT